MLNITSKECLGIKNHTVFLEKRENDAILGTSDLITRKECHNIAHQLILGRLSALSNCRKIQ